MDRVRVPFSLDPHEDLSAKYQKQLKMQRAGTEASEPDTMKAVSEEDSANQNSEVSGSASEATAANLQMSEERTAPSNESSKKD